MGEIIAAFEGHAIQALHKGRTTMGKLDRRFIDLGPTNQPDLNAELWMKRRGFVLEFGTWNWRRTEMATEEELRVINYMKRRFGYGFKVGSRPGPKGKANV